MKRLETRVNNELHAKVKAYCEKNDISVFKLIKDLILEKINGKTLDDFADN